MDVALFCVAAVGLAAFVTAPLYRAGAAERRESRAGPAEAGAAGAALSDLEMDLASGLIDEAAYAAERRDLDGPTD